MSEFWTWLTDNFNNRELAGAVWLVAILIIFVVKKGYPARFGKRVVRAALDRKLLILFSGFAANVVILSWLGTFPNLWSVGLITPTIVWYFFGGLPLLARAFDAKEGTQHFRGYAKDTLSGTALLEFILVAKSFSLPIELILTPPITVIAMMVVVSERNPEHAAVNKLLTWVVSIIALVHSLEFHRADMGRTRRFLHHQNVQKLYPLSCRSI